MTVADKAKQVYIASLAVRQMTIQKDFIPRAPIRELQELSLPTEQVLELLIQQKAELQRYKEKFGEL